MTAEDLTIVHAIDVIRTIGHGADIRQEPYVIANDDDVVVFTGWVFAPELEGPHQVCARIADTVIPASRSTREDVAAVHGEACVESGFSAAVAVGAFDEALLDVELCLEIAQNVFVPFERRRIVVSTIAEARQSEMVRLDFAELIGDVRTDDAGEVTLRARDRVGFSGWGYETGTGESRYEAAALLVAGKVYQAAYGLERSDVLERVGIGPSVGFYCEVPTARLLPGSYDCRARLYDVHGHAIESINALRFRIKAL